MGAGWHDFFWAISGVAATLLGLSFVAFQMGRSWHEDELRRFAAVQTLTELLVPVLVGLSALMPNHAWRVVAVLCGAAGLGLVAWHQWAFARHSGPKDDFDRDQRNLDVLSVITYTLTVVAGAARLPTVLALALLWLIFSGASEALMFMRHHDVPPGRKLHPGDRDGQRSAAAVAQEMEDSRSSSQAKAAADRG